MACPAKVLLLIPLLAASLHGEETLPATDLAEKIGVIVNSELASRGVPSASLAVVKDGKIAYLLGFGKSRLDPERQAASGMRYAVGSISKQFTAAAILLLVEEGKLQLDDPVAKFFPDLMRAREITVRMLLSHTSGYSDYWPQDYVMTDMLKPTTPQQILTRWAKKPLDFDPGTRWQYSNTNYVLAGYFRHAIGPLRIAPKEGAGWLIREGLLVSSCRISLVIF